MPPRPLRFIPWVIAALGLPSAALGQPAGSQPTPHRPRIAIFDVKSLQGVSEGTASILTEIMSSNLAGLHRYEVVTQRDVKALLGLEQQKKMLRCSDDGSCLAEIGGALGADYVLDASVGQIGSRYRLSLTLLQVKKARAVARVGTFCDKSEDALAEAAQKGLKDLLAEAERKDGAADLRVLPPGVSASQTALSPQQTWGLRVGAAGLAVLAAGVVFDILAYSAYQDEKKAGAAGDGAAYQSAQSRADSRGTAAKVLYVTGAIAAGTGAVLYLTGKRQPASIGLAPVEGGAVALVSGSLP